jgi:putative membrane protein
MTVLASLQGFLSYFFISVALLAAFLLLYTLVTPTREWKLIRQGDLPAAISLSGATLGFVIPLATAIVHSDSLPDMLAWAAISLVLQLLCFAAIRLLERNAAHGGLAEAVVLATLSVALGLLNAACMT